jgi:hypothetical protein
MGDVLEAIGLILIIRQFHLLFVLDDLEWFLSKCFEADLSSHESVCFVGEFVLVDHFLISFVVYDCLDSRLVCVHCEDVELGRSNRHHNLLLFFFLMIGLLLPQIFLQFLFLLDLLLVE